MKYLLPIIIPTLLLTSCGGEKKQQSINDIIDSGNISILRKKKKDIEITQLNLSNQLDLVNDAISAIDTTKKLSQITTIKVTKEVFNHYLELQGNVSTKQNIIISPEFNGVLNAVYVEEGQIVKKNQLLAKIDDGGLGQQLAQLKIQTTLAKTTFERQERLWKQKIGSEIQYLQAKSNYEAQREQINQLNSQLAKTEVRAPFDGTIDDVITDQGNVVAAGMTPLIRIVNLNKMYIETNVPEAYLSSVVPGKTVYVDFPILNKTITASVRQAGNFINAANRTFKIEINIPNMDQLIKPNLTAKLRINDYSNESAFLIPQSIISENADGKQYVYIVQNTNSSNFGVTKRVIITTGKNYQDQVEVLNGLKSNMLLIEEGARSVKEGQEVEIINQ